jgi:hypothetical protein
VCVCVCVCVCVLLACRAARVIAHRSVGVYASGVGGVSAPRTGSGTRQTRMAMWGVRAFVMLLCPNADLRLPSPPSDTPDAGRGSSGRVARTAAVPVGDERAMSAGGAAARCACVCVRVHVLWTRHACASVCVCIN